MTTFCCKSCGSTDIFIKENGSQTGLYCSDCGKWIKWVGKEDKRLAEIQINEVNEKINNIMIVKQLEFIINAVKQDKMNKEGLIISLEGIKVQIEMDLED